MLNITFRPSFAVNIPGASRCTFSPYEAPTLAETGYQLVCFYPINYTEGEPTTFMPLSLLKTFEQIKIDEVEYAQMRSERWLWRITTIILAIILAVYFLYNEAWIYKEE